MKAEKTKQMIETDKSLIEIPKDLSKKIKMYQIRKNISLKKEAIVEMLKDFVSTPTGKELTK